jgi:hypothetical protein
MYGILIQFVLKILKKLCLGLKILYKFIRFKSNLVHWLSVYLMIIKYIEKPQDLPKGDWYK